MASHPMSAFRAEESDVTDIKRLMARGAFSTWQLLRYPLVFGGCLAFYFAAFSYRKTYFKEEIEEVREKNLHQSQENNAKLEIAKSAVYAQRRKDMQV